MKGGENIVEDLVFLKMNQQDRLQFSVCSTGDWDNWLNQAPPCNFRAVQIFVLEMPVLSISLKWVRGQIWPCVDADHNHLCWLCWLRNKTACDLVRLITSGVNLLFPPPGPFIKYEMGVIG